VPVSTPPAGCAACERLASTGSHEPYVLEDVAQRLRLWRCTACRTLWQEVERAVIPARTAELDALVPGWRDEEAWLTGTSLPDLLVLHSSGGIEGRRLVLALLHHDVLVPAGTFQQVEVVTVFSSVEAACLPEEYLVRMSFARAIEGDERRRVVIDPGTAWTAVLPDDVVAEARLVGRATRTWPSRMRGDEGPHCAVAPVE
jgi:hypothetical protein